MSNQPMTSAPECYGCIYQVPERAAFVLDIDWLKWVCLLGLATHDKPLKTPCAEFDAEPF